MGRLLGSGILIVIAIAVIVVIALVPLFTIYKSSCGKGAERETAYNFVLPWNDPPADCRDAESGFEIVKDAVGL